MPHPSLPPQSLAVAYHALVQALTPEHVVLLSNFLVAFQRATLKEMNALVAETAHEGAQSEEVA